ncbi:helix-turn-helix domain-containing protein [Micromonospora sp. U21]|uniref:helix-turn-helix domain-containing protein n=1 Tax=Micromonospora sp. U21 TaxID=2824899 RepID=UPI001B36D593|nr:helix-turn-helix domain-containing protein [Micromonospora sp. U21]MBQ0907014.1 helix-turn-helix domain-containing protein [Micromonospora sp. U21]
MLSGSYWTVYRLIKARELTGVRIGRARRVVPDSVEAYKARLMTPSVPADCELTIAAVITARGAARMRRNTSGVTSAMTTPTPRSRPPTRPAMSIHRMRSGHRSAVREYWISVMPAAAVTTEPVGTASSSDQPPWGARHCRAATTAMAAAISTVGVIGQRAHLRNAPTGWPRYWLATTA